MALDFTGQHRIRIGEQDYALHGFTVVPAYIQPAGIAPGVQEAMRAAGPPQPQNYSFETVSFSCDITLDSGATYDYGSADNQPQKLKILSATHPKYRGVLQ
jgi:hypothetical protein